MMMPVMPIPPPLDKTGSRLLYHHRHSSPDVPTMAADYANTLSPCHSSSLMSEADEDDDIPQSTQRSQQLPPLPQRLQHQQIGQQQPIIRNRVQGQRF